MGDGWARTSDGRRFDADLVIGADGARSTVRRWVSPDRPDAVYAGFVLWRAMVPEAELPAAIPWLRPDEPSREYYSGPYRLVTYPVPGADGSSEPGDRRLNLVWYDPARSELLASRGLLDGVTVHGSLAAARRARATSPGAGVVAGQRWPTPWREALDIALRRSLVFATPVVQYWPDRLVRSRVALAGDAAHAASPMVGGGFRQGLYDVAALAAGFQRDRDRRGQRPALGLRTPTAASGPVPRGAQSGSKRSVPRAPELALTVTTLRGRHLARSPRVAARSSRRMVLRSVPVVRGSHSDGSPSECPLRDPRVQGFRVAPARLRRSGPR